MNRITLAVAALVGCINATTDVSFKSMGKFKVKNAAFPSLTKFDDSEDFLLVSSFGALSSGEVYITPGVKDGVTNNTVSDLKAFKLGRESRSGIGGFEWPNDVKVIPGDVFADTKRSIVVPDGFLVPGKANGGVYIISIDDTDITKATKQNTIAHNKDGFFYHMGYWVDMNGDGRKDFLTAKSNMKPNQGQLVWYEHPEGGLASADPWTEHVVCNGPDVGTTIDTTSFKDMVVVYAAEFFNQKLAFYRVSTKDGTLVDSRVIDDSTILDAYSVAIENLNNDKDKQLLTNNHEKDSKTNGVFAYTFPKDIMKGEWKKTTLASNFVNKFSIAVPNMAPGFPYAFWPKVADEGHKPAHILVAGDGDHTAHIMTPTSKLVYDRDPIKDEGGTVGALTWGDLSGNGWNDLFVPNYDKSYIEVFTFSAPAAKANATNDTDPCNGVIRTEDKCNANSECTWCKCSAVPSACYKVSDAAGLPSSIF